MKHKKSLPDICNQTDIKLFVDVFYGRIKNDPLLAPIFTERIPDDAWEKHLNRMYGFWNTVLFFQKEYKGNPFAKHMHLEVNAEHFQQWLYLFKTTIDSHFQGPTADSTKNRADKMAALFAGKIAYLKQHPNLKPLM